MQLTRFDRWLRERFVHEIHVYSLRPAVAVPKKVKAEDLPEAPGRKFRHRYIARRSEDADRLIESLQENNQMFTTRIVDREGWHVPLVAPKNNRSVTWWWIWVILIIVGLFFTVNAIRSLWNSPEFRENLADALEILKG